MVVAALAVTLAWPARALLDQRRELSDLRADNQAAEQRVADLQKSLTRWQDKAYVEAQARARLHFIRPGETAYVVVGPDAAPGCRHPARDRAGDRGLVRHAVAVGRGRCGRWRLTRPTSPPSPRS